MGAQLPGDDSPWSGGQRSSAGVLRGKSDDLPRARQQARHREGSGGVGGGGRYAGTAGACSTSIRDGGGAARSHWCSPTTFRPRRARPFRRSRPHRLGRRAFHSSVGEGTGAVAGGGDQACAGGVNYRLETSGGERVQDATRKV